MCVELAISMRALSRHLSATSRVVAILAHSQSVAALIPVLAVRNVLGRSGLVFFAYFSRVRQRANFSRIFIGFFRT